ncbi:hypothetical protein WNY78_18695, partial [Psychroserpens sp. AS72]
MKIFTRFSFTNVSSAARALVLVAILFSWNSNSQNILTNPGLDVSTATCNGSDALRDQQPDGWIKTNTPDRSTDNERSWDGFYAASTPSPSGGCYFGFRVLSANPEGIGQNVTLVAGETYRFTFDYLIQTRQDGTTTPCVPEMEIRIDGSTMAVFPPPPSENVWVETTTTFVAPTSGTSLFEFFSRGTCGRTWNFVDNLDLRILGPLPIIVAEDDDFSGTPIDSASGGTTASVFGDNGNGTDTADGVAATNGNIADNISISNDGGLAGVTINTDGTIDVPAGTTSGTYTVEYTICLEVDPTICTTADVTIEVDPTIVAEDDDFSGTSIDSTVGGTTASVFGDNGNGTDTADGVAATDGNIADNISITNDGGLTGVTINTDGTINVPAGTTSGTFTVEYTICLDTDPTICTTADVTIEVDPTIVAQYDDFSGTPFNPVTGGTTGSVFDNNGNGTDLADDVPATNSNISDNISIADEDGLTGVLINSDGTIDIPGGALPGTYNIQYTICLEADPTICDTATVIIVVNDCADYPTNDCDGDGVINSADLCAGFDDTADADGDLIPDGCDDDDDNDGLLDIDERGETFNGQPVCGSHTTFDFSAIPTEETGDGNISTLLEGEVFRFPNVQIGVDALVTLVDYVNAEIDILDDNSSNVEYFKPGTRFTSLNPGEEGYVEINIQFVNAGTSTLAPQATEVFINLNDIDGNPDLKERDRVQTPLSYVLNNPTEVTISNEPNFLLVTSGNVNYPGSSNANPNLNVSTRYENFDSYTMRLGVKATNSIADVVRYHSIEFDCVANFTNPVTTDPDTDNDGIPDYLDSDSDGDGCPDALEGDGGYVASDLDADDSLGDVVDGNGVPQDGLMNSLQQNDVSSTDPLVNGCENPNIEAEKTAAITDNGDGVLGAGDTINYTITVENTGDVVLTNVGIVDTLTDLDGNALTLTSGPIFNGADQGSVEGILLVDEIATYLATYVIT